MGAHSHDEIEQAFRRWWRTGAVCENWDAWVDLFTEDAVYADACERFDADYKVKQTRLNWGCGPEWTRGAVSYAERPRA